MKPIQTQSQGMRPIHFHDNKNNLSIYTYLFDVEYEVRAHFEWNLNRPDLKCDRNENKHFDIIRRTIEKGGRRDIFLGARECQGYVEPCRFGEKPGFYDNSDLSFGIMVHGITYPDEVTDKSKKGIMSVRLWTPVMRNGIIKFIRPEECTIVKDIGKRDLKKFEPGISFSGLGEFKGGEF